MLLSGLSLRERLRLRPWLGLRTLLSSLAWLRLRDGLLLRLFRSRPLRWGGERGESPMGDRGESPVGERRREGDRDLLRDRESYDRDLGRASRDRERDGMIGT